MPSRLRPIPGPLLRGDLSSHDSQIASLVAQLAALVSPASAMSSEAMPLTNVVPAASLYDLPHVELLGVASVDFEQIAEGCCTSMTLNLGVEPSSNSNKRKLTTLKKKLFHL